MRQRAPVIGGNFAVWASLFSAFDCAFFWWRKKEDAYNPIMAGAATGAYLAGRGGPGAMIRNGIFGGIFLAVIEGVGIMFNRMMMMQAAPPQSQSAHA